MPTLKGYMENWLSAYVDNNCKFSTASGYRQVCKKHLYPALGARTLDHVTRKDVKDLVATWNSQGLKKRTILNILTPLRETIFGMLMVGFLILEPRGLAQLWRRARQKFSRGSA